MKNLTYLSFALIIAFLMGACSDDSGSTGPEPPGEQQASAEQQFVYNSMNYWYYWQGDVPDLADDRFENDDAKQQFLSGYSDAEALFEDLQFIEDDFSFFIDDYEEFQDNQDGIFAALGFNYGLIPLSNSDNIVGYVQYIIPDSPGAEANLERGDIFTRVDGTQLTRNNFRDLLTGKESYEFTLAEINDDNQLVETNETVTVQDERVIENPIFASAVIDTNSTRIGYLIYNAFQSNSHQKLNDVFGDFKAQGIDELILDLRYNGGGAVITSQTLASMISGLNSSNQFAEYIFNEKRSDNSQNVPFLDVVPLQNEDGEITRNDQGDYANTIPMNKLSLNRLYVLTGFGTASASEALINGLGPFMDIVLVGEPTVGKDEGSLTLYDAPAPYLDEDQANPDHKKAIQPIVLKIANKNQRDYPQGFQPDFEVIETSPENLKNLPPFGSIEDPMFRKALSLITGESMKQTLPVQTSSPFQRRIIMDSNDLRPRGKSMYIEPFMMPVESKN